MWVAAPYESKHTDWECFDTEKQAKARVLAWEAASNRRGVWFFIGTDTDAGQEAVEAICGPDSRQVDPELPEWDSSRQKGGNE